MRHVRLSGKDDGTGRSAGVTKAVSDHEPAASRSTDTPPIEMREPGETGAAGQPERIDAPSIDIARGQPHCASARTGTPFAFDAPRAVTS